MATVKGVVVLLDPEEHYPVVVDARDRRAFELVARDVFGKRAQGPLRETVMAMPETYAAWCAWHCLTRTGALSLSWPEFSERFSELAEPTGASDEDPTRPGPTPG